MVTSTFFDLQRELTTNTTFINKAQRLMDGITKAERAGEVEDMKENMKELLTLCEFNPSLLVPYYFPKFPDQDPMTLWSRPHAFAMMSFTINGSLTIQASRQVGKCITGDTEVTVLNEVTGKTCKESMASLFNSAKQAAQEHQ